MRVNLNEWKILDWKGGDNITLRVFANQSFLARDDDDSGVLVEASPNVFREVACVTATETIDGIQMRTLTIPIMWLFSTTDGISNRTSTYRAGFYRGNRLVESIDQLQDFQVSPELLSLGDPTYWEEIIRFNSPAAPIPLDRETYSKEQILDLLGSYLEIPRGGTALSTRIAYWGIDDHTLEGTVTLNWDSVAKRMTLSDGQFRAIQVGAQVAIHARAAAAGATRILQVTDSVDAELFGISRTTAGFAAALTTTFSGPVNINGVLDVNAVSTFDAAVDINAALTVDAGVTFSNSPAIFNVSADFNSAITVDAGATFTGSPAVFNVAADFNSAITVDGGATFTTSPVTFNIGVDFNNAITIDGGSTFSTLATFNGAADFNGAVTMDGGVTFTASPVTFNIGVDFNNAITVDAQSDFSVLARFAANVQFGRNGVGTSVVILDDNAVGTSDIRAIDNTQGVRFFATDVFGNNNGARLHLYGTGHANTGQAFLEAVGNASAFISFGTSASGAAVERERITALGEFLLTPGVRTTGGATRAFRFITPADTGLTADTEAILMQFGGTNAASPTTATRQFTTGGGSFTVQREFLFVHPTYGATAATETIARAATVAITDAPAVGTNMAITQRLAFHVESGLSRFDSSIVGNANENTTFLVDATGVAGFPATRFSFHPTGQPSQLGLSQWGQTSSLGTRDILLQLTPDQSAGYGILSAFGSAGLVLRTENNTNPVIFQVNSVELGRFTTAGLDITGPASGTNIFRLFESGDGTARVIVTNDGLITTRAGNGATPTTATIAVDGLLHVNTTVVGNVGTGSDALMGYTVEANTLAKDGDYLYIIAGGKFNGSTTANSQTVAATYNGNSLNVGGQDPSTANDVDWQIELLIIRTGATTCRVNASYKHSDVLAASQLDFFRNFTLTITHSNSNVLQFFGNDTGGTNDKITQTNLTIWKGTNPN